MKTAHMIAVQMAQNNAIEVIGLHSGRAQPTAYRLTAVQKQRAVLSLKRNAECPGDRWPSRRPCRVPER